MHLQSKIPIEFEEVVVMVFSGIWPAGTLLATSWVHLRTFPTSIIELFVKTVKPLAKASVRFSISIKSS